MAWTSSVTLSRRSFNNTTGLSDADGRARAPAAATGAGLNAGGGAGVGSGPRRIGGLPGGCAGDGVTPGGVTPGGLTPGARIAPGSGAGSTWMAFTTKPWGDFRNPSIATARSELKQ